MPSHQSPNALAPFHFENKPVHVVTSPDGDTWFSAPDVCRVLDMADVTTALRVLDPDEKRPLTARTLGGDQLVNCISEPGLYKLLARSRKPEAKRFDRWVRHEVLPSIRKTGAYAVAQVAPATLTPFDILRDPMAIRSLLRDPSGMRNLLLAYNDEVIVLEGQIAVLKPRAEALDRIAVACGSLCITDAAKALQQSPRGLFTWLRRNNWIFKRSDNRDCGYQLKIFQGLLEHKLMTVPGPDRGDRVVPQVRVTMKGMAKLAVALGVPAPVIQGDFLPALSDHSMTAH